jgi:hypothetical protein
MRRGLETGGERVAVDCSIQWVAELIAEAVGAELCEPPRDASVTIRVEGGRQPFPTRGWTLLTRGVFHRAGEVVVANACTAGFDIHVRPVADRVELTYRWRPPARDRAAALALRSRFHLLARAVLLQYPVLWWAGTRGRAPLHANAFAARGSTPLVTAASGVGRSTLVLRELRDGATATGDNISVGDGTTVWGLVEPLRVTGAAGRRMPHGRNEEVLQRRSRALVPDSLVVLRRGTDGARLEGWEPETAARSLVASTYMAGELRRYWAFAATLAAGTGIGPAAPPVTEVATAFTETLPVFVLVLPSNGSTSLSQLFTETEVARWA